MPEYTFTLVKRAKKYGGDKYECGEWVVYFPQAISRESDVCKPTIVIQI